MTNIQYTQYKYIYIYFWLAVVHLNMKPNRIKSTMYQLLIVTNDKISIHLLTEL